MYLLKIDIEESKKNFRSMSAGAAVLCVACEQALLFGQAKRASRERFAARSRVLARLVSLAQIGELARRLFFVSSLNGGALRDDAKKGC